jgi:hypothetical protein
MADLREASLRIPPFNLAAEIQKSEHGPAIVARPATVSRRQPRTVAGIAGVAAPPPEIQKPTLTTVATVAGPRREFHNLEAALDAADRLYEFEERAAIMEFGAGMSRADAEAAALAQTWNRSAAHAS